MEEIKFRGQKIDKTEMVFGDYSQVVLGGNIHAYITPLDSKRIEVIPETFGLFMNFKDRNGTDVYFDDIVKDSFGRIMKVGYHNYRYCFISINEKNFKVADFFNWIENGLIHFEVIGNIHQNPELLTAKIKTK